MYCKSVVLCNRCGGRYIEIFCLYSVVKEYRFFKILIYSYIAKVIHTHNMLVMFTCTDNMINCGRYIGTVFCSIERYFFISQETIMNNIYKIRDFKYSAFC